MASKNSYIVFAVIGIAAASGAAWWLQKPAQAPRPEATGAAAGSGSPAGGVARGGPQGGAGGTGRPVAVEVVAVRQMALRDDAEAVGSLRSRQSVVLRPEVSGRITQLNFRDGERVRRGQVLVQFDDQLPRAQVQQSQAELSIAQANHNRNQELVAQGFISQRSVDESAANMQVAQAKLALAQATASRLKIVAPFDGIAGIRGVNVGDYLKDGADIVNVEDLDAVYVDFRLPERLQSKIRTGQTAQVAFDALPGVSYPAVVQAINPQIDADGRAVAVRGCIDNRRMQLRPGMFARVTAVFSERSDARVIPEEAVVPDGASPYVLKIVEGKEPGTRITQRTPVTLGARMPGFVEVVDGLSTGDFVVAAGQQRIQRDGTAVRVVELGAAGNNSSGPAARVASGPTTQGPVADGAAPRAAVASAANGLPGGTAAASAQMPSAPLASSASPPAKVATPLVAPLPGPNPCQLAGTSSRSTPVAPAARVPVRPPAQPPA
ncbi:MAG: efflux RND transporter periplasmic adaptor subunit [Acidovorax sp.]|uniref:efflux RND transporter periplasmic adaptor subunit n=1 Tax=Acidovorax sp. TaxID=1872122 RepID=UPI003919CCBB